MAKQPVQRVSKWYKADDEAVHFKRARVAKQNKQAMRKSIQEGSVLIMLSGKYRGKRVVCLKAFDSGLLLVTGPFRLNGVPLKRVNQAFVMSTSAKVDLTGVNSEKITEKFFQQEKAQKAKNSEGHFFQVEQTQAQKDKAEASKKERVQTQKDLDSALLKNIQKQDLMKQYLSARFTVSNQMKVHDLKF